MMTLEEAKKQLKEFEDELASFTMEGEIAKVMKALGCQRRRAITIAADNRVTILGNIRKMKKYVEQLDNQDKDWLDKLKKAYPKGTRVKLVRMDDVQAPPIGTKGTVEGVDDIGSILVKWDNGSSLNVVYGEDKVERLPKCCICGSDIEGYGNNPAPVAGKCCCDKCNNNVIVPYRLFLANLGKNNCGLLVKKDSLELITPKKDKFTLSELQKFVDGYIEEEAQILTGYITFADEEGKLKNKEFNELGYKLFETDLVGDFIIVPRKLVD